MDFENGKEYLQSAIESIKRSAIYKGENEVSEKEMAKKILISHGQLNEYLNEHLPIPEGLVHKLLNAYGIRRRMVESIVEFDFPPVEDDEMEDEE